MRIGRNSRLYIILLFLIFFFLFFFSTRIQISNLTVSNISTEISDQNLGLKKLIIQGEIMESGDSRIFVNLPCSNILRTISLSCTESIG